MEDSDHVAGLALTENRENSDVPDLAMKLNLAAHNHAQCGATGVNGHNAVLPAAKVELRDLESV